jgi:hypothetical protein
MLLISLAKGKVISSLRELRVKSEKGTADV